MKYTEVTVLPDLMEGGDASVVASSVKTSNEKPAADGAVDLTAFQSALGQAFSDLASQGARPPELHRMTMVVPDVDAFRRNVRDYDLAFREVLAGNFPEIFVTEDRSLSGPCISLSAKLDPPDPDTKVYADFTQQQLDFQYSPRQQTKNPEQYFEHWRVAGPAYQSKRTTEIWFGDSAGQSFDLFMPPASVSAPPLHIFIHGGYWQALDKKNHAHMADPFVQAGIAVAMVNYDLMPDVDLSEILRQVRAAVVKACAQADDYGYDCSRLTISGHSVGGHMVGALLCTDWPKEGASLPENLIKGALPISGLFDLEPLSKTGMNRVFRFTKQDIAEFSPIAMRPRVPAPVILSVGGDESGEFHRQSAIFREHLRAHGFPVSEIAMPGHNHFSIVESLSDSASPLSVGIIELIQGLNTEKI